MPRFVERLAVGLAVGAILGGAIGLTAVRSVAAADPQAIELEIESTISITKLNGYVVVDGVASVIGRIRLEPGATPGTWRGRGELASTTTSANGGCGSIHVEGTGTYDWVVNEVVVAPGIEPERIVAHMDAGTVAESPDAFDIDACSTVLEGTMNTWENLFFILHNADYGAQGLEVDGWQLEATGSTWADGELIASASWAASCGDEESPRRCTEETVFRLYSVGAATGGASATPAAPPVPSATPEAPASGGGLAVQTVDPAGGRLTHACLELWTANGDGNRGKLVPDSARCDQVLDPRGQLGPQDGRPDGSLGWSGLAPGRYVLVETLPPIGPANAGYPLADDTPFEIVAGAVTHLSLTHFMANALTIFKVDAAG
ncbi:MAG TPA: hypothetical protein VFC71_04045, partial [Candidatus Polarisedimenticolia bacterium]|nr:hypothetical protein [Candidatus Polarisedimenticolia bacterium]